MTVEEQIERLTRRLAKRTGCSATEVRVVYSPLRISPLGAHIDHQDGLVTGMTLDQALILAFVPRDDRHVRVESLNFQADTEFDQIGRAHV